MIVLPKLGRFELSASKARGVTLVDSLKSKSVREASDSNVGRVMEGLEVAVSKSPKSSSSGMKEEEGVEEDEETVKSSEPKASSKEGVGWKEDSNPAAEVDAMVGGNPSSFVAVNRFDLVRIGSDLKVPQSPSCIPN